MQNFVCLSAFCVLITINAANCAPTDTISEKQLVRVFEAQCLTKGQVEKFVCGLNILGFMDAEGLNVNATVKIFDKYYGTWKPIDAKLYAPVSILKTCIELGTPIRSIGGAVNIADKCIRKYSNGHVPGVIFDPRPPTTTESPFQ